MHTFLHFCICVFDAFGIYLCVFVPFLWHYTIHSIAWEQAFSFNVISGRDRLTFISSLVFHFWLGRTVGLWACFICVCVVFVCFCDGHLVGTCDSGVACHCLHVHCMACDNNKYSISLSSLLSSLHLIHPSHLISLSLLLIFSLSLSVVDILFHALDIVSRHCARIAAFHSLKHLVAMMRDDDITLWTCQWCLIKLQIRRENN